MMTSPRLRRTLFHAALCTLLVLGATACSAGGSESKPTKDAQDAKEPAPSVAARNDSYDAPPTERLDPARTWRVRLATTKGELDITVDPKAAPIAAANFVFLVKEGYYDGIVFHRIIKDFMVQTGDPLGTGTGGPGYELKDDPVRGTYSRGTVAMANAGPDTGGSQFFIVHGTGVDAQLPKDYVIFGRVDDEDLPVLDRIAGVPVELNEQGEPSRPTSTVRITRATLLD